MSSLRYCPKCSGETLQTLEYKGVVIEKCPKCNGVWLDEGEEAFVVEILQQFNNKRCKDCMHLIADKKQCKLLNIFVTLDFQCSNFFAK